MKIRTNNQNITKKSITHTRNQNLKDKRDFDKQKKRSTELTLGKGRVNCAGGRSDRQAKTQDKQTKDESRQKKNKLQEQRRPEQNQTQSLRRNDIPRQKRTRKLTHQKRRRTQAATKKGIPKEKQREKTPKSKHTASDLNNGVCEFTKRSTIAKQRQYQITSTGEQTQTKGNESKHAKF